MFIAIKIHLMDKKYHINWISTIRLLALWLAFYLFIKYCLFWLPDQGISFKGYSIGKSKFIHSLTILMIAKTITSVSKIFIWDFFVAKILNRSVPYLFVQCISASIYLIALLSIVYILFGTLIVGILTTLGGLGVIIGLSLQRLVLDAFSGVLLNADSSLRLGDLVKIDIGTLSDINWRLTTVTNLEGSKISIPNNMISGTSITNISKQINMGMLELVYYFSPSSDDRLITEILNNAVLSVSEIGYIEKNPPPEVQLFKITHNEGAVYKIIFYPELSKNRPDTAKHFLNIAVLRHVKAAGIDFYDSTQEKRITEGSADDFEKMETQEVKRLKLLKSVSIFDNLNSKGHEQILTNMTLNVFRPNQTIISQGEEGDSMHIIEKGFVKIYIKNDEDTNSFVTILNPGDFFGEMSLLTGEKRTATIICATDVVTYEITKDILEECIEDNPEMYDIFSKVVENKIKSTNEYFDHLSKVSEEKNSLMLEYINKFKSRFLK